MDITLTLDEIRAATSLVAIVEAAGVKLTKKGRERTGLCPFHDDRHPSLSVSDDKGLYHCHACGAGGDVFSFLMDLSGRTFLDVVRDLAGRAGIVLPEVGIAQSHQAVDARSRIKKTTAGLYTAVYPILGEPVLLDVAGWLRQSPSRPSLSQRQAGEPALLNVPLGFAQLNLLRAKALPTVEILNPGAGEGHQQVSLSLSMLHRYADLDDQTVGYVARSEWVDGAGARRKMTPQIVWAKDILLAQGEVIDAGWCFGAHPRKLPYGAQRIRQRPGATKIWFEGEKAADAGERLLGNEGFIPLAWAGGAGEVDKVEIDAEIAAGRHILCPDNDTSGFQCMQILAERLIAAGADEVAIALPPDGVPKKWDVADAEWSTEQAVEWTDRAVPFGAVNWAAMMNIGGEMKMADVVVLETARKPSPATEIILPEQASLSVVGREIWLTYSKSGPGVFMEPATLTALMTEKAKEKEQYKALKAVLKGSGLNMASIETRGWLAMQGITHDGLLIHERVITEGAVALQDEDVLRTLADMRENNRTAYTALKKTLRNLGADGVELDRAVILAGLGGQKLVVDGADPIRQILRSMGYHIRPLGFHHGVYFYLPSATREIIDIKASEHKPHNLVEMAPLEFWEAAFPPASEKSTTGANWLAAARWLMDSCQKVGLYDINCSRGRGVWFDDGRTIVHLGDRLVIDGDVFEIDEYEGRFVYERGHALPAPAFDDPLNDAESYELLEVFSMLRWENPLSALLMGGWVAASMICGALDWRPHCWLTGMSGSGKSYIQSHIVNPLLKDIGIAVASSTTEAGIRHSLHSDALPVIFDEAEAEDQRAQSRIQGILELARVASSDTGGDIRKGSSGGRAQIYRMRSMFFFASVGVSLKQQADISRFVVLNLGTPAPAWDKAAKAREAEQFRHLQALVERVIRKDTASRLLGRLITMIPMIRANTEMFTSAAAEVLGSQRMGDQMGVLLACAWAMTSSGLIGRDEAIQWIKGSDWEEHLEATMEADQDRCKNFILSHLLRVDSGDTTHTRSVGELVTIAAAMDNEPRIAAKDAGEELERIGLKVEDRPLGENGRLTKVLFVHPTHARLGVILKETTWSCNWNKILGRLAGARATGTTSVRCGALNPMRGIWIPLSSLFGDDREEQEVLPTASFEDHPLFN